MFEFFRWHKLKKEIKASVEEMKEKKMDINEILAIEDSLCLVTEMRTRIYNKCDYGSCVEKLSEAEMVFYLTVELEGEVINGGFGQFFDNSSGNFANETEAALRRIGAEKTADIYKKALDALGGELPRDRKERWKALEERETEAVSNLLAECDGEFYKENDDLNALLYEFVMKNKEQFE